MKNYTYPIAAHWTKDELTAVIDFLTQVEKAYEARVKAQVVLAAYQNFKTVVPSKAEEKQIMRQFEKNSGYVAYPLVKQAQHAGPNDWLSL